MSTTYTPGPWTVKELGGYDSPGSCILVQDKTKPGICMRRLDYKGEFRKADAHLIAAAPDLLTALDNLQSRPNDPAAHRFALDALAKARGN